ncbi:MAG: hypothetical protein IKN97_07455 [Lachnospiraceae bacterium]|nr:hypothetical protein [Lachnospiraceae bacterium]
MAYQPSNLYVLKHHRDALVFCLIGKIACISVISIAAEENFPGIRKA